jgi:hypothetical protein
MEVVIRGNARTAAPQPAPQMTEGEGDHVHVSPERDTPPRSPVTLQVLGGLLLVCLGLLLGATWTAQALQARLGQQAEERRRLNAEWAAVRTASRQRGQCPRCGAPLSEWDWSFGPTPPDDD